VLEWACGRRLGHSLVIFLVSVRFLDLLGSWIRQFTVFVSAFLQVMSVMYLRSHDVMSI
jgi:hypothetical protein